MLYWYSDTCMPMLYGEIGTAIKKGIRILFMYHFIYVILVINKCPISINSSVPRIINCIGEMQASVSIRFFVFRSKFIFCVVCMILSVVKADIVVFSVIWSIWVNPLSPHDALKHHFTSLYIYRLNFPTTRGFMMKISLKLFYQ